MHRRESRWLARALLGAIATVAAGCSGGSDDPPDAGVVCAIDAGPEDAIPAPSITTPRWAFLPWISKDISDRDDTLAFVQGFVDRDIPVGVVVLDSPWETNYNTFVPNPSRYGDFAGMLDTLHGMDLRLVLWTTSLYNSVSFDLETGGDVYDGAAPDYDAARTCGFFVENGAQYFWWKGQGAAVDFFDPTAMRWWHSLQDPLYDLGIDGWKLDFGESYITSDPLQTAAGPRSLQAYSEAYYHDFYAYGAARRGGPEELVTMVRGYDASYQFAGRYFARPEDAPVVWMGDNTRDWAGLADALDHTFRSAQAGYVVLGSDIGGYLDVHDQTLDPIPFDPEVFARWVAVGGLSPFMQLHGRANLAPWDLPAPATPGDIATTVDVYRYYAKLHTQLIPFWYSLAEEAYGGAEGIVRPVEADPAAWPDDFRYMLGEAFLVAPVLAPGGVRDVALPGDASVQWVDWWAPGDPARDGGSTVPGYDASDWMQIPLFVRRGAIVPMDVSDGSTGLGTAASAGHLTVLVWPDATESSFVTHDDDGGTTTITAMGDTVILDRTPLPTLLRVWRAGVAPTGVSVNGVSATEHAGRAAFDAAASGWYWEDGTASAWVKLPAGASGVTVAFQ